jgi:glutamine phosphoribosylpyrophosphate amidotransferase
MHAVVASAHNTYCDACFTGKYPVDFPEAERAPQLPLFEP